MRHKIYENRVEDLFNQERKHGPLPHCYPHVLRSQNKQHRQELQTKFKSHGGVLPSPDHYMDKPILSNPIQSIIP